MYISACSICVLIIFLIGTLQGIQSATKDNPKYVININLTQILSVTEEEYLSYCLDPYLKHDLPTPWGSLNFSHPRVHTLARGLSPAILRFGGTNADYSVFFHATTSVQQAEVRSILASLGNTSQYIVPIFPDDINNLHGLAKSSAGKFLFDLNLRLRYGKQWDPSNALKMIKYIREQGYLSDMYFELGNEPNFYISRLDGQRIGQDFLILKSLLSNFPELKDAKLVGPDIGNIPPIPSEFAATVKNQINAFTLHSYYFRGPGAHISQYYNVSYFDSFEKEVISWREIMWKSAGAKVDVWVGETSDSYSKGTPNITNRYASGFLWLDKLGISARNGYKLVARQDFFGANYPLISDDLKPNPDYWLSYVFKQLVGTKVLQVNVGGPKTDGLRFRVYGHCTSSRSNYPAGSITLYMVNINSVEVSYSLDSRLYGNKADFYYMTPENGDIVSPYVNLNGAMLNMIDDETLPVLKGQERSLSNPITMPALSYGFVVLKEANSKICSS